MHTAKNLLTVARVFKNFFGDYNIVHPRKNVCNISEAHCGMLLLKEHTKVEMMAQCESSLYCLCKQQSD